MPVSGASAPVSRLISVVLPLPFGPTMPMRSPRWMRIEKSRDDRPAVVGLADPLGLDHQRAGLVRRRGGERGLAGGAAIGAARLAQRLQAAEPADVALAPRGDAVAQPVLLGDDLAVELVLLALLLRQHLVAPGLEGGEAALDAARLPAVEPDGAARQVGEKPPVVADHDQRGAARQQLALEPFDGGEIEMVGRLVEQQDVGRRRQHARERRAARLAAGEVRGVLAAVEPELLQEIARLVAVVAGAEAGLHIGERRCGAGEIGLLRQIAHGGARLQEARAAVGLDQPGGDLEQGRLARAVAADQADALAGRDRQLDAGEQRRAAEGQRDVLELDEGRGHCWLVSLCGRARCSAADRLVERGEKGGAVSRRERRRPARHLSRRAQVVHQVADRKRHSDRSAR